MSGRILQRLVNLVGFGTRKQLIGRDLEGNKYFEVPQDGGRPKRVVEYRVMRELSDYTSGHHRLPVQWTSWLSYTRTQPPTIDELQNDLSRQSRLQPLIAQIAEREAAERIRQGYLSPPPSQQSINAPGAVAESSFQPVPKAPAQTPPGGRVPDPVDRPGRTAEFGGWSPDVAGDLTPGEGHARVPGPTARATSEVPRRRGNEATQTTVPTPHSHPQAASKYPSAPSQSPPPTSNPTSLPLSSSSSEYPVRPADPYPIPTPPRPDVAPPRETADPAKYASAEDLRRMSEEDTRRRMKQSGVKDEKLQEAHGVPGKAGAGEGVQGAVSGGLAPRRRRK